MYKREGFETYYAYPNYNSGYIYSTLIIASDDQSISESDICSLDQKTIGYYDQSISRVNSIEDFLAANDVSYNLKRYDDYNEYVSALKNKEVDVLISNDTQQISDDSVFASTPINDYLREPNINNVLYYETLQECIEAINSGQADYTLGDNYSIEYLMANNNYRDIVILTFEDTYKDLFIGLNKNLDYKLQTIINKAIRSISAQEKATIVLNSSLEIENEVTLKSFLDSNPHTVQTILLAVIVIIGLVLALFLMIRVKC